MTWIEWTDPARDDLLGIMSYLADQGEETLGKQIVTGIVKATDRLERSPLSGRPGRVSGTREIVVRKLSYIIVYRLSTKNRVEILRVIHAARLWPEA